MVNTRHTGTRYVNWSHSEWKMSVWMWRKCPNDTPNSQKFITFHGPCIIRKLITIKGRDCNPVTFNRSQYWFQAQILTKRRRHLETNRQIELKIRWTWLVYFTRDFKRHSQSSKWNSLICQHNHIEPNVLCLFGCIWLNLLLKLKCTDLRGFIKPKTRTMLVQGSR